jgi:hypothetical protein
MARAADQSFSSLVQRDRSGSAVPGWRGALTARRGSHGDLKASVDEGEGGVDRGVSMREA